MPGGVEAGHGVMVSLHLGVMVKGRTGRKGGRGFLGSQRRGRGSVEPGGRKLALEAWILRMLGQ